MRDRAEDASAFDAALNVIRKIAAEALENLAGTGKWQRRRSNVDAARAFVAGDQRLAEFHQFLRRCAGAAFQQYQ